jgi:hypothetical protein
VSKPVTQTPSPGRVVEVLAYGPEPIGAAAQGALDRVVGSRLSGETVLIAAGLRGYDDSSAAIFASPQLFPGAVGAPVISPGSAATPPGDTEVPSSVLPPAWS